MCFGFTNHSHSLFPHATSIWTQHLYGIVSLTLVKLLLFWLLRDVDVKVFEIKKIIGWGLNESGSPPVEQNNNNTAQRKDVILEFNYLW